MKFLERDLEEIIETTNREDLIESGLEITGKLFRQLRIGNYGIADLITIEKGFEKGFDGEYYHFFYVTVYELKKDKISMSAYLQAIGYAKGIQSFIRKRFNSECYFDIVLIGKKINTDSELCYLPDIFDNVRFYTYEFRIDGLKFQEQKNYYKQIENFNI